ncbi:hypothetical protein MCOR11_002553 [Pyricularia oryzae]|nr:hypothetical protein MCOR11_002553 [Pyricularia oryzae]
MSAVLLPTPENISTNEQKKALEAREHTTDWIAHAAEVVFADCFDGFVGGEFVSGRRVHDDLVVVVIRDSFDC